MPDDERILLLRFDPEDGRVIIARNNPDNARYIVVMIPGVGTGPKSLDPLLGQAETLFRAVANDPDDDEVSVITWADYLAPQSAREARNSAFAAPAAPRLTSFLIGARVTNEEFGKRPGRARLVVVTRGYGGLVAGLAARDHELDTDALVFLGCAGAGVDNATALRGTGPVYAASADDIGDGTPLGVHGTRPDSPGFGATVLRSGPLSFRRDPFVRYVPALRRIILGEA